MEQRNAMISQHDAVDHYDEVVEEFEELQAAYNTARTEENTRRGDFFANMFDPVIAVPHRPSAPWVPEAYEGVSAMYTITSGDMDDMGWYFASVANRGALDHTYSANLEVVSVQDSTDYWNATGHVFGWSGQGTESMPGDDARAWCVDVTDSATGVSTNDQPVMMVSIFPQDATMAGAAARVVNITASAVPFYENFAALPFYPEAYVPAVEDLVASVDGAKALTAGLAVAALSLSLF